MLLRSLLSVHFRFNSNVTRRNGDMGAKGRDRSPGVFIVFPAFKNSSILKRRFLNVGHSYSMMFDHKEFVGENWQFCVNFYLGKCS